MPEPTLRNREAFTVLGVYDRIDPANADWGGIWGRFMHHMEKLKPMAIDDCVYGVYLETDEEGLVGRSSLRDFVALLGRGQLDFALEVRPQGEEGEQLGSG